MLFRSIVFSRFRNLLFFLSFALIVSQALSWLYNGKLARVDITLCLFIYFMGFKVPSHIFSRLAFFYVNEQSAVFKNLYCFSNPAMNYLGLNGLI